MTTIEEQAMKLKKWNLVEEIDIEKGRFKPTYELWFSIHHALSVHSDVLFKGLNKEMMDNALKLCGNKKKAMCELISTFISAYIIYKKVPTHMDSDTGLLLMELIYSILMSEIKPMSKTKDKYVEKEYKVKIE